MKVFSVKWSYLQIREVSRYTVLVGTNLLIFKIHDWAGTNFSDFII